MARTTFGSKMRAAHLGEEADGAGADDGYHVAFLDLAAVGAEVAGREDVAGEERLLVADAIGHFLERVVAVGHAEVLGLGAGEHDEAEAIACGQHWLGQPVVQ